MPKTSAYGIRSVDLAVRDLEATKAFYEAQWGLKEVARENGSIFMRATGKDHHVLAIHKAPRSALMSVNLGAKSRADVDALHAQAKALGTKVLEAPHELAKIAGGGYGFAVQSPEGQKITISAGVAEHGDHEQDASKPERLSHVVLNAAKYDEQIAFYRDVLGFRLSDTTDFMDFMRCCEDHHSVAVARAEGACLNHMAYELPNIEGLMKGAGRMKQSGFDIGWGVGRHGPGDNVFSYFIEPNGFVTEYTTGMEQVKNDEYEWHGPDYWATAFMRPCRWGMATTFAPGFREAMKGNLVEERNNRCDTVIAQGLAQGLKGAAE
jgi:catechol-2,3-dioxygenase